MKLMVAGSTGTPLFIFQGDIGNNMAGVSHDIPEEVLQTGVKESLVVLHQVTFTTDVYSSVV